MTTAAEATALPAVDEIDGPLPRRERKRREVRNRLYEAAISLFTEQGFEATTMDAIAERADVARATVFNYYGHKVAFLEEWGGRRRGFVARRMAASQLQDEPVASQLRRYLRELSALNVASRAQTAILMDAAWRFGGLLRYPAPGSQLSRILETGVRHGEIRVAAQPAQTEQLLWIGYLSTVLRWIEADPSFSLTEELESMLDIVLRGVLSDPPTN